MKRLIAVVTLLMVCVGALAHDHDEAKDLQVTKVLSATATISIEAEVDAIDHENRIVVLRDSDGLIEEFEVDPQVRNLEQVRVGDLVQIESIKQVDIHIVRGEGLEPTSASIEAVARAAEGELPGLVAHIEEIQSAMIVAIDIDAGTVVLRNEDGQREAFQAVNPENLYKVRIGDLVVLQTRVRVLAAVTHPEQG